MRFPRNRGIRRFKRGMDSARLSGIRLGRQCRCGAALLGSDCRLVQHHHGNFIADRIDALARLAFQSGVVGRQLDGRFAHRASQHCQQFLGNRHVLLPQQECALWSWHSIKGPKSGQTPARDATLQHTAWNSSHSCVKYAVRNPVPRPGGTMRKNLRLTPILLLALFAAPCFAQAPAAQPEEKTIAVFGQTIKYWDVGSGPVVVLVHGLGSAKDLDWGRVVAPLSQKYRLLVPDQIGFGHSDKPLLDYKIQTYVDFLNEFLRELKIEKASLVGESLGGWISALYVVEE